MSTYKIIFVSNTNLDNANALMRSLIDGYKIISAVGTREGVQYILEK